MHRTHHRVKSSQIHSVAHDPTTNTMQVTFNANGGGPGSTYAYDNVPDHKFESMKNARSAGGYFISQIKSNAEHPYRKLNDHERWPEAAHA